MSNDKVSTEVANECINAALEHANAKITEQAACIAKLKDSLVNAKKALLAYEEAPIQSAELAEVARAVIAHFKRRDGAPGHSHTVPGVWDLSNKPEIAGKPCEWCATWERFVALAATPAQPAEREIEYRVKTSSSPGSYQLMRVAACESDEAIEELVRAKAESECGYSEQYRGFDWRNPAQPAGGVSAPTDALHAAIMNLPCTYSSEVAWDSSDREKAKNSYKEGHSDARHAAAELVAARAAAPVSAKPGAWMTEDGRVATAQTKETAMPKQSAVNFNIPLYFGAAPVSQQTVRKAYICKSCDGVYADQPVTHCDCMPDKQEYIEGVIAYPSAAPVSGPGGA